MRQPERIPAYSFDVFVPSIWSLYVIIIITILSVPSFAALPSTIRRPFCGLSATVRQTQKSLMRVFFPLSFSQSLSLCWRCAIAPVNHDICVPLLSLPPTAIREEARYAFHLTEYIYIYSRISAVIVHNFDFFEHFILLHIRFVGT